MSFLLDTNICSAFLRERGKLYTRFLQHTGNLAISSIALAELYTWAYRRPDPQRLIKLVRDDVLADCDVLDFDDTCTLRFGELRASLMAIGINIHPPDLMIAAVALEHDLTLVTHNVKHFDRIPDLRVEDWLAD